MKTIRWVPGAIATPNPHTLPAAAARLCTVIAAYILRPASGLADHPAATVITGVTNHGAAAVIAGAIDHPAANVIAGVIDHAAADITAALADHTEAEIIAAIADHAVHNHPLLVQAVAAVEAYGASGVGVADIESVTGQTIPANQVQGGVQNNLAAQAHAIGGAPVVHGDGAVVAHAAGAAVVHAAGAAVAHVAGADVPHVGANPVVAAVATKVDVDSLTLDVNSLVGDLLVLLYRETGETVDTS